MRALRECGCMMCAWIHDRVQGLQLIMFRHRTAVTLASINLNSGTFKGSTEATQLLLTYLLTYLGLYLLTYLYACLLAGSMHRPRNVRHCCLFVAIFSISLLVSLIPPIFYVSFPMSLCQVFRGLLLRPFPWCFHVMA